MDSRVVSFAKATADKLAAAERVEWLMKGRRRKVCGWMGRCGIAEMRNAFMWTGRMRFKV